MIWTRFPTISFRSVSPFSLLALRGSPHTPLPVTFGNEPGMVVIVEYAILDLDSFLIFGSALSILTNWGEMANTSDVSTSPA